VTEVKIAALARKDIQDSGGILGRAFQDDPAILMMLAESGAEERTEGSAILFMNQLLTCSRNGSPMIVRDAMGILAAFSLYPPGTYPIPPTEQVKMILLTVLKARLFRRQTWLALGRGIKLLDEMQKKHPKDPHYYLEVLGVDPGHQGKGIGSMILGSINEKADKDGVGFYLETAQPRNLPLYKRFGYQIVDQKDVLGVTLWFMWRNPGL
jgi:GNAT superfamily N-acetyltransferase